MRICLVGATHPCHNPRLIREADSLAELGFSVRVVAPSFTPELAGRDRQLVSTRGWRLQQVQLAEPSLFGRIASVRMRARRRLARISYVIAKNRRLAEYASCAAASELADLAASEPADWFIAHTQPILPVAAAAARKWNARLGFDCEDLLTRSADAAEAEIIGAIEKCYLSRCAYITVPSPAIGVCLNREYDVDSTVLYNVFPLNQAKGLSAPEQRQQSTRMRLHWVGQTIGRGKGIEEAAEAAALLGDHVELHLRGKLAIGQTSFIRDLERRFRIHIDLHPLVHHDALVATVGEFDVGLALEKAGDSNAALTVSNKLFLYLLSGLAIAATDTVGQREVIDQVPDAGFLYPSGKPDILAEKLRRWVHDGCDLVAAKQAAWKAAREKFCWENTRGRFLKLLGIPRQPAVPDYDDRKEAVNG